MASHRLAPAEEAIFMVNLKEAQEELRRNPVTPEEMLLAHIDCPTCEPFFKITDIFYSDIDNIDLMTFCNLFINRHQLESCDPLIQAQFNHLCWLHQ